jgi:hypothetical protein
VLSFADTLAALQALLGERVLVEVTTGGGVPVASFEGTLACGGRYLGPDAAVRFGFAEYDDLWTCGFWVDPSEGLFKGAERLRDGSVEIAYFEGVEISVHPPP